MTFLKFNNQNILFSLIALGFLTLIRFISLFLFQAEPLDSSILTDLLIMGFRFDARIVATVLLLFIYIPAILLHCLPVNKYLNLWFRAILSLCLILIVTISFINIAYLLFFGNPIDVLVFGFIDDGTLNVIKSILSDFRFIIISLISIAVSFLLFNLFIKKSNSTQALNTSSWVKTITLLCIIPFMFIIARGSMGTFPLFKKQAEISNNRLVNSLTQNAIYHLYNAFLDRSRNNFNGSPQGMLKRSGFNTFAQLEKAAGFNEQNPLIHTTKKNAFLTKKPPHVIFVQMEGWSSQIALTDSEHTLGEFNQHRLDDYFFTHFFSNAYGTNPTIEALLLNSPITPLSQSSAYSTQFKMSNVLPFKRNNYHTVFLSGGHASWRNHNKFWLEQGFDEYIGRASIAKKYGPSNNTWGVYDEYLFSYLAEDLKKQIQPTFYYVLTTNNHPPVELPPDYKTPDFDLTQFNRHAKTKEMLTGYSYQSNAFGNFMTQLKNSDLKDKVIVVATGDHVLKGFDNYHPVENTYIKYSVPAYFYVPKAYDTLKDVDLTISGSHNDLFSTIFELALPNTSYYAFGTALMNKSLDNSYGWIQNNALIVKQGVIDTHTQKLYPFAQHLLLKPKAQPLNTQHKRFLTQLKNQKAVEKYLLYQDKEVQHEHNKHSFNTEDKTSY